MDLSLLRRFYSSFYWRIVLGVYDTLVDGDMSVQIKFLSSSLNVYHVGNTIDNLDKSYVVILPYYEDASFAIVENGVFMGLTNTLSFTKEKREKMDFIDKHGNILEKSKRNAMKFLEDLVHDRKGRDVSNIIRSFFFGGRTCVGS